MQYSINPSEINTEIKIHFFDSLRFFSQELSDSKQGGRYFNKEIVEHSEMFTVISEKNICCDNISVCRTWVLERQQQLVSHHDG